MVTIFLPGKKNTIFKNFYLKSHLNALARQDKDKHYIVHHSKKTPSVHEQKGQERLTYMLEGSNKRRTKSFTTKYTKPLPSEIVRKESVKSKFTPLVSRKLKPLQEIYYHDKFHYISKIKQNLFPYVIEEILDEETDEGENREKEVFAWRKTPDPRKKYLNSLVFEYR